MNLKVKVFILSFVCVAALFIQPVLTYAEDNVSIIINDKYIEFDSMPIIEDGRVLVPFRPIFEEMGMTVYYDQANKTIVAEDEDYLIFMQIDNKDYSVLTFPEYGYVQNIYTFDVPPKIIDGRTYIPVGSVFGAIDYSVAWNGETKTVILKDMSIPEDTVSDREAVTEIILFEEAMVDAFENTYYYVETDRDFAIDQFNYIVEQCLNFKEKDFSYISNDLERNTNAFCDIMVSLCGEAIIVADAYYDEDYEMAKKHNDNVNYYIGQQEFNKSELIYIYENIDK